MPGIKTQANSDGSIITLMAITKLGVNRLYADERAGPMVKAPNCCTKKLSSVVNTDKYNNPQ